MLIEQSIAKQYGVLPSQQEDLRYADWVKLVGGLMGDTPLGQVVTLRSEKNSELIRHFTPAQRAIRSTWRRLQAEKQPPGQADQNQAALQRMIAGLFGGGQ